MPDDDRLRAYARDMRHEPTDAEARLWEELRDRRLMRLKFRRQVPLGPFIADFVCMEARLIVEVDGSQHGGSMRDRRRDDELQRRGFRILRFWNDDVLLDLTVVCDTIVAAAREQGIAMT